MRRVLGKGLAQLLGEQQEESVVSQIRIDAISPNAGQPRKTFDAEALQELADSIKQVGMVQPIVVRQIEEGRYEIIAGERRWRAAKLAGLHEVPVVIRSANATETLALALIENIQREDIAPLECAEAYHALIAQHGLTQEELSQRVGKSRPSIANSLRLLKLPQEVRASLASGAISEGHARALLQFETEAEQLLVHRRIIEKSLSVREVERMARGTHAKPRKSRAAETPAQDGLESALSEFFGTPTRVVRAGKGGKIEIEFYGDDDLSRILDALGITL